MPRKIPKVPENWQSFGLSIVFHLLLTVLPLALEYWISRQVSAESLMLVAALYAISVSVSSTSRLFFGLGIVTGMVFAVAFGAISGGQQLLHSEFLASWSIIAIFVIHACERWNLHIVDGNPYWNF
jgi:cytochrome bd-type quinol oxidase subunit 1